MENNKVLFVIIILSFIKCKGKFKSFEMNNIS